MYVYIYIYVHKYIFNSHHLAVRQKKVLEGHVPNFGIRENFNARTGRYCQLPHIPPSKTRARTQYCNSLVFRGPQVFNCSPKKIRNIKWSSIETFKYKLDELLTKVPDQPTIQGYTQGRSTKTNSIIDQLPTIRSQQI